MFLKKWNIRRNVTELKNRICDILYTATGARCFLKSGISRCYYEKIKHHFLNSPYFVARLDNARLSFSQEGEDLILKRMISSKIKKGTYVDIGAHHPTRFSNTYLFYLQGWSGINIEPNPDVISLFAQARSRDINLNMGVAAAGQLEYFMLNDPALNTFSEEKLNEVLRDGNYFLEKKIKVLMRPLADILDEYWELQNNITFMNIDCEGYDYQVIASNNWHKYRPSFILVECIPHSMGNIPVDLTQDTCTFLESVEYIKVASTRNTFFWRDKKDLLYNLE